MNYDIIGDIHGRLDKLDALLRRLGYREHHGAWRHPDRTAVFVGDLIDRGPHQVATVDRVRRMVDAGAALCVMGNHESDGPLVAYRWEGEPELAASGFWTHVEQGVPAAGMSWPTHHALRAWWSFPDPQNC